MKIKLQAARRLLMADEALAPAESFRSKNEEELKSQQNDRQKDEDKEAQSPTSKDSGTAVKDTTTAARTPSTRRRDLPTTDAMYAGTRVLRLLSARINAGIAGPEDDPLTHDQENAALAKSTVDGDDMPGMVDGFNTVGQEGNQLRAAARIKALAPSTADDDPVDYEEGIPTALADQPNDVPGDIVLSDADPKIWNMAQQPMGGMG
jgi:hypothetical protein